MDIFAKLNDKQQLAVKNTEGFVRVIAGAGSGKTKLLVSRYVYLVKEYGFDKNRFIIVGNGPKRAVEDKVVGSNNAYRTTDFQLVTE